MYAIIGGMHPSQGIHMIKSDKLAGKKIVLGITGSIGAIQCIKFARECIRHGAEVIPVMSDGALDIITAESIRFATGHIPVTRITGDVEHIKYCGVDEERADLFLIAPCTANTISKIAVGICDTPVTLFATTALGSNIPLMILPAMHGSMYNHAVITENMRRLGEMGVVFIDPLISENKAKMANVDHVIQHVLRAFGSNDLIGKKILVIAGSTAEPIDDVRMITNRSSGLTGLALAVNAFERGGEVELWYGRAAVEPPYFLKTRRFDTVDSLLGLINYTNPYNFDIIINCAAISDYTIEKTDGKIKSGMDCLTLTLKPTPKVIEHIRRRSPDSFIVAFKLESGVADGELIAIAEKRLSELDVDMMVANKLEDVRGERGRVFMIHGSKTPKVVEGRKTDNARDIFTEILSFIND